MASLSVSGAPVRDSTGHISGAVTVFRDVTERRQLERRVQESLDALLAMAETLVLSTSAAESGAEPARSEASVVAKRLAELTCRVLGCRRVGVSAVKPGTGVLL